MAFFEDTGMFKGMMSFDTDTGEEVRAIDEGATWGVYVFEDGAFQRLATVRRTPGDTPRDVWDRIPFHVNGL